MPGCAAADGRLVARGELRDWPEERLLREYSTSACYLRSLPPYACPCPLTASAAALLPPALPPSLPTTISPVCAMPDSPTLAPASRKGKERQAPQPTNIADKLIALQRKQARSECVILSEHPQIYPPDRSDLRNPIPRLTKPKERPDRPDRPDKPAASSAVSRSTPRAPSPRRMHAPPIPSPNIVVSQPTSDPYPDEQEFSRRLKISSSSPRASHSKAHNGASGSNTKHLYNPNADPMRRPVVTAEPEAMSDGDSSSYAPRAAPVQARHHGSPQSRGEAPRLFDPRKDNPHKFAAQARPVPAGPSGSPNLNGRPTPTPKSSGDYVSASSTSSVSYAQSTISSSFTFSSTTTDSSQPSAIFDSQRRSEDSTGSANALSSQLKRLYRTISALEDRVAKGDAADEEADRDGHRLLMKGRPQSNGSPRQEQMAADEEAEREKWRKLIADHKECVTVIRCRFRYVTDTSFLHQTRRSHASYVDSDVCAHCPILSSKRTDQVQSHLPPVDDRLPPSSGEPPTSVS